MRSGATHAEAAAAPPKAHTRGRKKGTWLGLGGVLVALVAVGVARRRWAVPGPAGSPEASHGRMRQWFREHPFGLSFRGQLQRFFVDKLVRDPEAFELPVGQFWPRPRGAFEPRVSWIFTTVVEWVLARVPYQTYSGELFYYRLMQTGVGYADSIDPGAQAPILKELATLRAEHGGESSLYSRYDGCEVAVGAAIRLAVTLTHNGEDWPALLDAATNLCLETCVTPRTCLDADAGPADTTFDHFVRQLAWVSWLRYGEFDNCREHHNKDRCLWPIRDGGVHQKPKGSSEALKYLAVQLQRHPEDIGAKWHLNLAHMTLGTYPDSVPEPFLIGPEVFASKADIGKFENVAQVLGVDVWSTYGAVVVEDFDNDGRLDSFHVGQSYDDPVKLFRGTGAWERQEDATAAANLEGIVGGVNVKQADYNNDGFMDLMIIRGGWLNVHQPNSLLRNNGRGGFDDVTLTAGVWSDGASHGVDFADFDLDGKLDFFSWTENKQCDLFRNVDGETFEKVALPLGLRNCKLVKGAAFGDYDNDGYPDLYLSRYGWKNMLWRNVGGTTFEETTATAGVQDPTLSFPAGWFDFDQDGHLDIIVSGHLFEGADAVCSSYTGEWYPGRDFVEGIWGPDQKFMRIWRNNGNGTFRNMAPELGLDTHIMSMAMQYGDVNNDGFPDIYIGTGQPDVRSLIPNRLFLNDGGQRFLDITTSSNTGHVQKGHGICFTDLNGDGASDIVTSIAGAFASDYFFDAAFLNPGGHGAFLFVKLVGVTDNRMGIGARIRVLVGERTVHKMVHAGLSYGANTINPTHIGLGSADGNVTVEVDWPAERATQIIFLVPVNRTVLITQGGVAAEVVPNVSMVDITAERSEDEPCGCSHHAAADATDKSPLLLS